MMRNTRKALLALFWTAITLDVVLVALFENDVLPSGEWTCAERGEFAATTAMELLTLMSVPLALRLFRFRFVSGELASNGTSLLKWGVLRLLLLVFPLLLNTFLYYMFMATSFGYMAIILIISLAFVYPSRGRCESEATPNKQTNSDVR